jgi:hypothetical protein
LQRSLFKHYGIIFYSEKIYKDNDVLGSANLIPYPTH